MDFRFNVFEKDTEIIIFLFRHFIFGMLGFNVSVEARF